MYRQRLCSHVSLISYPYGDSSPPLLRHCDPYDPLEEEHESIKNQNYHIAIAVSPGVIPTAIIMVVNIKKVPVKAYNLISMVKRYYNLIRHAY